MAVEVKEEGSQTTVIGTEHQLGANQVDPATYLLRIDGDAFAKTEAFVLRAYVRTRSGDAGTGVLEYEPRFLGGLWVGKNHISIPVVSPHLCRFTLQQITGSARAVPWSILGLGDTVVEVADGSQTATIGVEHSLGSAITAPGTYLLRVDATNLAVGEDLELRAKTKTRSADTQRLEQPARYRGEALIAKSIASIVIPSVHELQWTLEQPSGSGRVFPWSIVSL